MRNTTYGRRTRIFAVAATATLVSSVGLAAPAAAQEAGDVEQLLDNAPAAGEALADGVQSTAETAAETQSAVETSAALGDALVGSGSTLVAGTEQFGSLGLGLTLMNQSAQMAGEPWLGIVDDPESAGDVLDPEDLSTIAGRSGELAEAQQATTQAALVGLLEGNLMAAIGQGTVITLDNLFQATAGTPYQGPFSLLGVTTLVGAVAVEPQVVELQEGLAPVFEGAEPVTQPLIEALEEQ